tara:strand:+ start:163 stop:1029 length:867 start_codon:yes stop_codon:yes gene_type:complete
MNIVKLTSIFLLVGVTACGGGGSDSTAPIVVTIIDVVNCEEVACEDSHKFVIEQIYVDVINGLNSGLVPSLYTEDFIQKNTNITAGISGQTAYFDRLSTENPNHVATIKHIVADGDYVAVHWHYSDTPENEFSASAKVDLYKLIDNKIVEQWYFSMNSTTNTASGNSVFSDLYDYTDKQPNNDVAIEEENKIMIADFYTTAFNTQNLTLIEEQVDVNYIQHNPFVRNGRAGLSEYIESGFAPTNVTIFMTLAEDDMVWTFRSDARVVDLWRVDNNKTSNKIVEHWDIF